MMIMVNIFTNIQIKHFLRPPPHKGVQSNTLEWCGHLFCVQDILYASMAGGGGGGKIGLKKFLILG